jgi:hypothetical protein
MATKQQVIDLNKKHPNWTARDIAEELGCMVEYVGACKRRYGLKFARATGRSTENPNSIFALGREARRAGLTIERIRSISKEEQVMG